MRIKQDAKKSGVSRKMLIRKYKLDTGSEKKISVLTFNKPKRMYNNKSNKILPWSALNNSMGRQINSMKQGRKAPLKKDKKIFKDSLMKVFQ